MDNGSLTLEKAMKTLRGIKKTIYYATESVVNPGEALLSKETAFTPEYYVFNPADFEALRERAQSFIEFVHLRDYKTSAPVGRNNAMVALPPFNRRWEDVTPEGSVERVLMRREDFAV